MSECYSKRAGGAAGAQGSGLTLRLRSGKASRVMEKPRTKGRGGFSRAERRPKPSIHAGGIVLQTER